MVFLLKKKVIYDIMKGQGGLMNKEHILKNNIDFQRIISTTRPYKFKEYVVYLENNTNDNYKFGFSVGKKIGNAVVRNHVKRQLRQIVSKKNYINGFNCIIIVNKNILKINYEEMQNNLYCIFNKINILKENGEKE